MLPTNLFLGFRLRRIGRADFHPLWPRYRVFGNFECPDRCPGVGFRLLLKPVLFEELTNWRVFGGGNNAPSDLSKAALPSLFTQVRQHRRFDSASNDPAAEQKRV